ncbi:helix-turn-helix domain-containing protein [Pyramidobacter piscolens]|uniref:helix-turn-helix domain-containing protein n=1 Tax=Pyramidobacter piscolens TaxID=638849 RepID=UPI0033328ACD
MFLKGWGLRKRLTLSDRKNVEKCLAQGASFAKIGRRLDSCPSPTSCAKTSCSSPSGISSVAEQFFKSAFFNKYRKSAWLKDFPLFKPCASLVSL